MAALERVDGEFQGKTFVVRLGHLSAEPDEQRGGGLPMADSGA